MKIKIFPRLDNDSLEFELNEFLVGKKLIDIKTIGEAYTVGGELQYGQTIMIMYEELDTKSHDDEDEEGDEE